MPHFSALQDRAVDALALTDALALEKRLMALHEAAPGLKFAGLHTPCALLQTATGLSDDVCDIGALILEGAVLMMGFRKWTAALAAAAAGVAVMMGYFQWYSHTVVTAALQPGSESTATTLDPERSERLLHVLTEARKRLDVPSLQAAVLIGGEGMWTGAVGWADPSAKRAATIEDQYHIGSVSKLYTAAAIMKLVEAGKLSLDDTVGEYVPGVPNGDQIRIRQLLNHTSGLPNYTEHLPMNLKTVLFHRIWEMDEVLAVIRSQAPRSEPGSSHYYSNSNYVLLGLTAEAAAGRSFADLLEELILQPLGLTHTHFARPGNSPAGSVRGYDVAVLGTGRIGIKKDMAGLQAPFESCAFTAGAVVASASDVARFTYALFGGDLLAEESLQQMLTFVEAPDEDAPEQTGYGLGVRRLEMGGETFVGHTGVFPGFSSVSLYSPAHDYAVAVTTNLSVAEVNQVVTEIQAILAEGP